MSAQLIQCPHCTYTFRSSQTAESNFIRCPSCESKIALAITSKEFIVGANTPTDFRRANSSWPVALVFGSLAVAGLFALLLAGGGMALYWLANAPAPQYEGTARVEIERKYDEAKSINLSSELDESPTRPASSISDPMARVERLMPHATSPDPSALAELYVKHPPVEKWVYEFAFRFRRDDNDYTYRGFRVATPHSVFETNHHPDYRYQHCGVNYEMLLYDRDAPLSSDFVLTQRKAASIRVTEDGQWLAPELLDILPYIGQPMGTLGLETLSTKEANWTNTIRFAVTKQRRPSADRSFAVPHFTAYYRTELDREPLSDALQNTSVSKHERVVGYRLAFAYDDIVRVDQTIKVTPVDVPETIGAQQEFWTTELTGYFEFDAAKHRVSKIELSGHATVQMTDGTLEIPLSLSVTLQPRNETAHKYLDLLQP